MQQEFFYHRLKFSIQVSELINSTSDKIKSELILHALDHILVTRRLRMLSQLGQYQQQIFKKIPAWRIQSVDDLKFCMQQVERELHIIIDRSS